VIDEMIDIGDKADVLELGHPDEQLFGWFEIC